MLKLCELSGVFLWQDIRHGRENLGHLHQRALEPTQCRRQFGRVFRPVDGQAKQPVTGETGSETAHRRPDLRVTFQPTAQGVGIGEVVGLYSFQFSHGSRCAPVMTRDEGRIRALSDMGSATATRQRSGPVSRSLPTRR
jgi:hypothetical protein